MLNGTRRARPAHASGRGSQRRLALLLSGGRLAARRSACCWPRCGVARITAPYVMELICATCILLLLLLVVIHRGLLLPRMVPTGAQWHLRHPVVVAFGARLVVVRCGTPLHATGVSGVAIACILQGAVVFAPVLRRGRPARTVAVPALQLVRLLPATAAVDPAGITHVIRRPFAGTSASACADRAEAAACPRCCR
jgi:hypothetical protein